ncbi:probable beta-1,3-galactosyltransferase 4 isoform X2 [Durio zibethinus]|uniref:Probable beta-1,3-galactosyltransferase 4 isoform X2 n=1 Tax=Durio zibethinus TaxID=66656 RepID=A0A6P5WM80_DURZI|nr:probable beta-1,3-galactosyltransferase 4 isoform X2 [Durio zibethinus]
MSWKNKGLEPNSRSVVTKKWTLLLCIGCFCAGMLFSDRMWTVPETEDKGVYREMGVKDERLKLISEGCDPIRKDVKQSKDILGEVSRTHHAIQTLDKTISNLEMELAAARAVQESIINGSPISDDLKIPESSGKRKYLMVVGINTAFSSRKRRDSVRATWMPQGEERKKLEEEKGIIMRFVIGHSATSGGILDRAIEAEDRKHGDFLRVEHVEGYLELSAKTKTYFATAAALWDADFYVKVDDDVHVNIATLGSTLARHRSKSRVYIGCMKSGPVLAQKGVRYHEPEYWKFGEEGNKYFRHATGQLYAISKDLASYISINQHVLHKYANEDVSLGSWFIGLDVEHIDDRRLCCGTTDSSNTQKPILKFLDCSLRLSVIPLSAVTIWLAVTNKERNNIYGEEKFSNLLGLKYMVCISAISAGYALLAVVASWLRCLVTRAWLFFVSDQIVAYLVVTSGAAMMEIVYLAYNGDQKITWSEACSTYGKFCNKMKVALILHALVLCCFIVLAVISAYRVFSLFEPPLSSKEVEEERT